MRRDATPRSGMISRALLIGAVLPACSGAVPARAATPDEACGPSSAPSDAAASPMKLARVEVVDRSGAVADAAARPVSFGDTLVLTVDNLAAWVACGFKPTQLTLFLGGHPFPLKDWKEVNLGPGGSVLVPLERADVGERLSDLIGSPKGVTTPLRIGLAGADGTLIASDVAALTLKVLDPTLLWVAVALLLAAVVGFIWAARKSDMLRDSGPPQIRTGERRPYSLARTQMAWWFFLVFGTYLFIFVATGDLMILNTTALTLIGVAVFTALGAVTIDSAKAGTTAGELDTLEPAYARLAAEVAQKDSRLAALQAASAPLSGQDVAELAALQIDLPGKKKELALTAQKIDDATSRLHRPVSQNFINDILSDSQGVSFHRFQNVVWTVALGLIFVFQVYTHLTMPTFDEKLLILMGISAGTYLGFKIPERPS